MAVYHVDAALDVLIDARDADAAAEKFYEVFGRDDRSFLSEPEVTVLGIYEIEQP